MTTQISQWGNSLGVRLPKTLGEYLGLKKGTEVEIYEKNGAIIIKKSKKYTLEKLLNMSKDSHEEVETGNTEGKEEW